MIFRILKLKNGLNFTPLEFKTERGEQIQIANAELNFTPLEFKTTASKRRDTTRNSVKFYSVGV